MGKKYRYEDVYKIFIDNGCLLLEEKYINNRTNMKYKCICGNTDLIRLDNFQKGDRCKECRYRKSADSKRTDYETVRSVFKKFGCILLSTKFISSKEPLEYICSCGRYSITTYDIMKKGHLCKECGIERRSESKKIPYEEVKKSFEKYNCLLLTDKDKYDGIKSKVEYICSCGEKSKVSAEVFYYGNQFGCMKCASEKRSGENNHRWNGGISTILQYIRYKMIKWKRDSILNSNYKCVVTGNTFDVIHHLYGFDQIINEAFNNLKISKREIVNEYNDDELNVLINEVIRLHDKYPPGVCLTNEVHDDFHKTYKYGKNTPEQFYEFYRMKTGKEYMYDIIDNAI
jgi:hypothetical protein